MLADQILEAWEIHSRITLYMLDAIAADVFTAPPPAKGRGVAQMLAHLHSVRLMWLKPSQPAAAAALAQLDARGPLDRDTLRAALAASATAVAAMVREALFEERRVKGFKPHTPAFVAYLIAHESYHHGEIGVALREMGHPLDRTRAYGMWEWGAR